MKLNLFTDYALRSLMYLTWHRDRTVTAEEIARFYGISRDHIVKVIQELSRQGFVQARRGRGGGSILAREPNRITVGEVVTTFEGPPAILDCLRSTGVCAIETTCRLKQALAKSHALMLDYLDQITIEEIAGDAPPVVGQVLRITPMAEQTAALAPSNLEHGSGSTPFRSSPTRLNSQP